MAISILYAGGILPEPARCPGSRREIPGSERPGFCARADWDRPGVRSNRDPRSGCDPKTYYLVTPGLLGRRGIVRHRFWRQSGPGPMHTWLPDAHSQAPSGISAMLSGVVIEAGLVAMLRALGALSMSPISWGAIAARFRRIQYDHWQPAWLCARPRSNGCWRIPASAMSVICSPVWGSRLVFRYRPGLRAPCSICSTML